MGEKKAPCAPARYNASMNRLWAPLLLALILLAPSSAFAQEMNLPLFDPEWHIVPDAHELDPDCPVGAPLGFGGILQLIQNVMNAGVSLGVLISVLVIAFAGMLWVLTPTNPENHSQAKKVLTNAVIGLIIILASWLIVDFVMRILYNPNTPGFGPWNKILTGGDICITEMETEALFSGSIVAKPGQGTYTGNGGSCTIQTGGPCAATALAPYFGTAANEASQVCYGESTGQIGAVSRTDVMRSDPQKRAFSFGLFQINLTQHKVGGHDCPAAFNGKNYSATVKNEDLYRKCVAAAKDARTNIDTAVRIYRDRGSWADWSAAKACGIADAGVPRMLSLWQ